MNNIPQEYSSADYARFSFLFPGSPPESGVRLQQLGGPMSVVAVHLNDGDGIFSRTLVEQTQRVVEHIGAALSHLLLINNEGDPPRALAAHPKATVVGDFEMADAERRALLAAQRRIALVGWDARACVASTLQLVSALASPEHPAEFHFPLGALDDAKFDGVQSISEAKVVLTSLMGMFARRVSDVRGRTDVSWDGAYLARHEEWGPGTALHFHSSPQAFRANATF